MLIVFLTVFLTILVMGLLVLSVWLWHRQAVRNRESAANVQPASADQEEMKSIETAEDGIQESSRNSAGVPVLAGPPRDNSQTKTREDSKKESEQAPSVIAVEDQVDVSAIEAEGGDISVDASDCQEVRSEPSAPSEQMENDDARRASESRLSRDNGIAVDDVELSGDAEKADSPSSNGLPIREGNSEKMVSPKSEAEGESGSKEISRAVEEPPGKADRKKKQSAVYRDRRGLRRGAGRAPRKSAITPSPPAKAQLRLLLDQIQQSASLSVVLMRPKGFPECIQPLLDGEGPIEAFDTNRYDDLALAWTSDLLDGELRIESKEGQQWLRAARAVHIFSENPAESGMISVGAARTDVLHAVVCKVEDEEAVRAAAEATKSPQLVSHEHWNGIPNGWTVLSGYCPRHVASASLPMQLSPLDPGTEVKISLIGGLAIRATAYAEGRPPQIGIAPLPKGTCVSIGDIQAKQASDGVWEAEGWDSPGHHLIDVVPGPSHTYQIIADPMANGQWKFWDAHSERFNADSHKPWGRACICGAAVRGPDGETVIAATSSPILIAFGERRQAVPLMPRDDVPASVAMISETPCFLETATGLRRKQGRIVWLGSGGKQGVRSCPDQHWVKTVRSIAARRLRLEGADTDGARVWQNTKQRARRIWKKR